MVINQRPDLGAPTHDPCHAQADALRLDNERLAADCAQLRADLAEQRLETDRVTASRDGAMRAVVNAREEAEQLRLDLDAYRTAMRARTDQLERAQDALRRDMRERLRATDGAERELADMARQRDAARAELAAAQQRHRDDIEAAGCELAATQLAKEQVIGQLVTAQEQLAAVAADRDELHRRLAKLMDERDTDPALAQARADVATVRAANTGLVRDLQGVSDSLVDGNVARARLARQVRDLQAQLAELSATGQHPCHFEWTAGGYLEGVTGFEPTVGADPSKGWWVRCACHEAPQSRWMPGDGPHTCPATGAQSNPPAPEVDRD